jgi:hypothetical protein
MVAASIGTSCNEELDPERPFCSTSVGDAPASFRPWHSSPTKLAQCRQWSSASVRTGGAHAGQRLRRLAVQEEGGRRDTSGLHSLGGARPESITGSPIFYVLTMKELPPVDAKDRDGLRESSRTSARNRTMSSSSWKWHEQKPSGDPALSMEALGM